MSATRDEEKHFRVWPVILIPVGLTIALGICVWLFLGKVAADQEATELAALRLESYARLEAGELASRALAASSSFVESRLSARQNQEKNLRLETRTVLDSAYRRLTAGLDKIRKNTVSRREVGPFPPGFDGVRSFLEITPANDRNDEALAALQAMVPEIATLLPASSSLTVVEDNARELLAVGGGVPGEGQLTVSMTRDFIFDDGAASRFLTLRLELIAPDLHPVPDAREVATQLTSLLGDVRLEAVAWRGWLLGRNGDVAATFPVTAATAGAARRQDDGRPPLIDIPGEWVEVENKRLVWLERATGRSGALFTPAVAVAIDRPPAPLDIADEFWRDERWCTALITLASLFMAGWIWFLRLVIIARRDAELEEYSRPETRRPRRRLVRDPRAVRAIPEVQGVIIADIDDDGRVRLKDPAVPPMPKTMPSGSLFRLQAMHRGRDGVSGSRVLDHARSQVLRELAGRVRPVVSLPAPDLDKLRRASIAGAAKAETIPSMKSPTGWRKVEDEVAG